MKLGHMEIKKLFSFRDIYMGLLLCIGSLILFFVSDPLPDMNFTFWDEMYIFIPRIGFWFIAIMVVVGLSRLYPFEDEVGIQELLKTYKYGKTKLVIWKIYTIFIYCFFIVTLFYLMAIVGYGIAYSFEGYNLSVGQSQFWNMKFEGMSSISALAQWQYLILEYLYMLFATFSFGLFVVMVSILVNNGVLTMIICGGIFAAFELYDKYIQFIWVFNRLIWEAYRWGYNGMLSFRYFIIDSPKLWKLILYIFGSIFINIWIIFKLYRRRERC